MQRRIQRRMECPGEAAVAAAVATTSVRRNACRGAAAVQNCAAAESAGGHPRAPRQRPATAIAIAGAPHVATRMRINRSRGAAAVVATCTAASAQRSKGAAAVAACIGHHRVARPSANTRRGGHSRGQRADTALASGGAPQVAPRMRRARGRRTAIAVCQAEKVSGSRGGNQ